MAERKRQRASAKAATIHDQRLTHGAGGELHQTVVGKTAVLTTA